MSEPQHAPKQTFENAETKQTYHYVDVSGWFPKEDQWWAARLWRWAKRKAGR